MKRLPRLLLLLLAYAMGGAIINVAVAWGSAVQGMDKYPRTLLDREQWTFESPFIAYISIRWNCWAGDGFEIHSMYSKKSDTDTESWIRSSKADGGIDWLSGKVVACATLSELFDCANQVVGPVQDFDDYIGDTWGVELHGWPMRSLGGAVLYMRLKRQGMTSVLAPPQRAEWSQFRSILLKTRPPPAGLGVPPPSGKNFQLLPCYPLWPGFAINTIFYAAMIWPLFAAPGFVRRRIRVRRGQCPACAYPVGASDVCTEFGRPVTPRA